MNAKIIHIMFMLLHNKTHQKNLRSHSECAVDSYAHCTSHTHTRAFVYATFVARKQKKNLYNIFPFRCASFLFRYLREEEKESERMNGALRANCKH